jgi:hypothetical protein
MQLEKGQGHGVLGTRQATKGLTARADDSTLGRGNQNGEDQSEGSRRKPQMSTDDVRPVVCNCAIADVHKVVYVSTNGAGDFDTGVNDYLKQGYRLLHVGEETQHTNKGLWHSTVAILGK